MVDILGNLYDQRSYIVPCLLGEPGIGKTSAVMEHAKKVGAGKVVTIIASQILPNEVSGITMPVNESKSMEIFDHYRLSSLEDGDILFFDELLEADQIVLSACLTLIESRMMMSGKKLPDIQIVAASNPVASPVTLKQSIRQRFMFFDIKYDKKDVINYIHRKTGIRPINAANFLGDSCLDGYNILTPRSLTKICQLLSDFYDKDKIDEAYKMIKLAWSSSIASACSNDVDSSFRNKKLNDEATKLLLIYARSHDLVLDETDVFSYMDFIENAGLKEDFENWASNVIIDK